MRYSIVLFLLSAICSLGCSSISGTWQGEEVSRTTSPDDALEAVVIEGSAGPTTGTITTLYIVRKGTAYDPKSPEFALDSAVFRADFIEGLKADWTGGRVLTISYSNGRIYHFTDFGTIFDGDGKPVFDYNIRLAQPSWVTIMPGT